MFPCAELPVRAGVWVFDARGTNQSQGSGQQYATGLRNMVALAVNPSDGDLYGVQHGRDLGTKRPSLLQRQAVPAEVSWRRVRRVHGGFDRAPLPNEGYNVMFVPMGANGSPSGAPEIFAGSAGPLPATAVHRPVGVTEGLDGSLYVSDDRGGRIWRIIFVGS